MGAQRQRNSRRFLRGVEREEWEQQIRNEEERMREEREQGVCGFNLTKEQARIRRAIYVRIYRHQAKMKREAEDGINRQKTVGQRQSDDETETFTEGRQKRVLSEEEQQLGAEREQAQEKFIREQLEHISWADTLNQQRKDRIRIRQRNRYRQLCMEREATDEKYRQKRMAQEEERRLRAEREQAEEKLMREEREQHILRVKTLTDQQRKDRIRTRERKRYHRLCMEREATDEKYRQKRMAQRNSASKETEKVEIDNPIAEASMIDHPLS